jgi:predicted RNase H-like HicB family nuclease
MPDLRTYRREVFWSEIDTAWIATVDTLSLTTAGHTPAEALAKMDVALEQTVRRYAHEGTTLPQPTARMAHTPHWMFFFAGLGVVETVAWIVLGLYLWAQSLPVG